jgi:hypothetical protein
MNPVSRWSWCSQVQQRQPGAAEAARDSRGGQWPLRKDGARCDDIQVSLGPYNIHTPRALLQRHARRQHTYITQLH